jgi:hypothetical protein
MLFFSSQEKNKKTKPKKNEIGEENFLKAFILF